jgi:hypothetical protein
MNHISAVLSEEISNALQVVCPMFAVEDSAKFALELMVAMGITERSSPSAAAITTPPRKTTPVPPMAPQKQRARVVSKKMKDAFLAMPGASDDKLKDIVEKYKDASQDDLDAAGGTFEGYAKTYLAIPATTTEVTEKKDDDKKRFSRWSPTSTKVFAEAIVANGGAVTNDLKKKFQEYVNNLNEDKFALLSIQGHMTRFAEETFKTEKKDDDDEDLEEFQFEDETLLIGTSSGKIYRSTPEAGDVLIGVATQGRFKDVAIPKK